jgi:hypothetical protein
MVVGTIRSNHQKIRVHRPLNNSRGAVKGRETE